MTDEPQMNECEACGSDLCQEYPATKQCPFCDRMKCERCDMGQDVPCIACEDGSDD